MTAANWISLGSVLAVIIVGGFAFISSRRANKIAATKLDVAAYERAKQFTDRLVDDLRTEVDRLHAQIRELRTELESEERENQALRKQVSELSKTANRLRYELTVLQQRLKEV